MEMRLKRTDRRERKREVVYLLTLRHIHKVRLDSESYEEIELSLVGSDTD